jgi:hypothetical protein
VGLSVLSDDKPTIIIDGKLIFYNQIKV